MILLVALNLVVFCRINGMILLVELVFCKIHGVTLLWNSTWCEEFAEFMLCFYSTTIRKISTEIMNFFVIEDQFLELPRNIINGMEPIFWLTSPE